MASASLLSVRMHALSCAVIAAAIVAPIDGLLAQTSQLPGVVVDAPKPRAVTRAKPRPARAVVVRAKPARLARTQRARIIALPVQVPVAPVLAEAAPSAETVQPGRADLSPAPSAQPAAATTVTAPQIARLPVNSYGDLFRSLPGFNVSDYGQGGIAYGLALRGYTEGEHGRDIAISIDGVPLNEVSSIHTPNYADLNILLPETVERIDIVRGPFSVEYGDSNLGGSIAITTKTAEPFGTLSTSAGSYGTIRGVGTYSRTDGPVLPFIAAEGASSNGYRVNSFVDRYNSFNKVTMRLADDATLAFRVQAYGTNFGAPSYLARDDIRSRRVSARAAVNPTDGGNKDLQNFVVTYSQGTPSQEFSGTLYVSHDTFNRFADFGGGQRWQNDTRTQLGGRIRKIWTGDFLDVLPTQLLVGASPRSDFIDAYQAPTTSRVQTGLPVIALGVEQHNVAGFAQLQVKPLPWVKLTGGARVDVLSYAISDRLATTPLLPAPNLSPTIISPKAGISITPAPWLGFFANHGQGFRSPDVPLEVLQNPALKPFKVYSTEGGAQVTVGPLRLLGSYWTTDSNNESFQPAPGAAVTFLGKARRSGVDLDGRFDLLRTPVGFASVFANATIVDARLRDAAPSFCVPNVPRYVVNAGVDLDWATSNGERLSGTGYVTFVGKKNLTQDGLLTTSPFSRVTAKLAYSWPQGISVFGQATWYPGDRLSEFSTNFGPPTSAATSDIFTSAQPALVLKAGMKLRFPTSEPLFAPQLAAR